MIPLEDAQQRILADLAPLGSESVDLLSACGRVLAEPVVADHALPAFDNSEMDGYAVRAADSEGASESAPVRLRIVEMVQAGSTPSDNVTSGTAARIFTGAPLPSGADAVIMQEYTRARDGEVELLEAVRSGQHVRSAGADFAAGRIAVPAGQLIGPGDVGAIASQGRSWVRVVRQPRIALVPTGNEVVEIDRALGAGQVANSNSHLLAASVQAAGAIALRGPVAPDNRQALRAILADAAASADLIVTSGGVSVGDFDLVTKVLEEDEALTFWRVKVKPGKPVAFGRYDGVPLIGLPGNPASSFVGFELFVRPALLKLAGHEHLFRPRRRATLTASVKPTRDRRALLRGRLAMAADGSLQVTPRVTQSSGHLSSLVNVNALIDVPMGSDAIAEGSQIDLLDLGAAPLSPAG